MLAEIAKELVQRSTTSSQVTEINVAYFIVQNLIFVLIFIMKMLHAHDKPSNVQSVQIHILLYVYIVIL